MSRSWSLALVAILPLAVTGTYSSSAPVEVSGRILAADDNTPLVGVQVTIWSGGHVIAEARSQPDGSYHLQFPSGAPIAVIYYDKPGWPLQSITDLSGTRNHVINKLLYAQGPRQLGVLPALNSLAAYESVYFASLHAEMLPADTRSRYRETLRTFQAPEEVLQRVGQIRSLWNVAPR